MLLFSTQPHICIQEQPAGNIQFTVLKDTAAAAFPFKFPEWIEKLQII